MPKPLLTRTGFVQGVKASLDPTVVPVDALWEARNVRADESGILRIRRGVVPFVESLGVGRVQGALGAFGGLLLAWDRSLYLHRGGEIVLLREDFLGTTAADAAEMVHWTRAGVEVVYLLAGNGLWITDGETVEEVVPYDPGAGESANLLTLEGDGPRTCCLGIVRASLGQRMAVAGDPAAPNAVYLSYPLDASYFPQDQMIPLPNDGGRITGLANRYGALVIFRDRDVWAFFGPDMRDEDARLVRQEGSVGCVAARTIANVPRLGLVWLGADNVYSLQAVSGVEEQVQAIPVGDDIRRLLLRALRTPLGACAVYHDQEYRLCFPASNQLDRVFRLFLQHGANWYSDTGPAVGQFIVLEDGLYATGWSQGEVYRFTPVALKDVDRGIPFYVAFRREGFCPGPARISRIFIYVLAKGQRSVVDLGYFAPVFGEGGFAEESQASADIIIGTEQHLEIRLIVDGHETVLHDFRVRQPRSGRLELSGQEPVRVYEARVHPPLQGHFLQLQVVGTVPGEDIALLGYAVEYATRRVARGKVVSNASS